MRESCRHAGYRPAVMRKVHCCGNGTEKSVDNFKIFLHTEESIAMKILNNGYVKVFSHKGFDICILRSASPVNGDSLGYVLDDERFAGRSFERVEDAMDAIDAEYQN